nr:unknown [Darna trima granulovirus]
MKLHNIDIVSTKRIKHHQIINIVRQMLQAYMACSSKQTVVNKLVQEYHNVNNKAYSETLLLIQTAFEILSDDLQTKNLLNDSFYRDCKLTNIVLSVVPVKYSVIRTQQKVLLQAYIVGDSQLCETCYKKLGGNVDCTPDINTECVIIPDIAYFFSCCYICDYCFVNKLYSRMCV